MPVHELDVWTLVHAGVGFGVSLVDIPLWLGIVGHQAHELFENSKQGIKFWRDTLGFTDYNGDTAQNSAADTLAFTLGWVAAYEGQKRRKKK
jgi:hypothetical protein